MTTTDSSSQVPSQGGENASAAAAAPRQPEHQISTSRSQVIKSGPLFLSSKGIGWTSWKKRWFVLTRTSLVFFRNDPNAATQKGSEMNLTLGGIDLNNSASVDVKLDKKLLTVFFPDGADGRAFTLKAETLEDLHEWKNALESAVAQAPSVSLSPTRNGVLEQADETANSPGQQNDKQISKSMVLGRPVLLALEDIDGTPSFLEKALKFIEDHGVRTEGILRQAADVEEVYRRVREFEQGKTEFTADEDAHVIGDCIKYILREMPSSPVPASCCTALLEAYRSDPKNRLNAIRNAILETFPEPNRKLLQRILVMMLSVASHKAVNRMSVSAVAACMSPLLLRPLLNGECVLENTHMDVAGDGSFQLLQAAAAANHAQAIVILLLEEYKSIFGQGGSITPELFSDSEECETGSDDDDMYEEDEEEEDDDHEEGSDDYEGETDEDYEDSGSEICSSSGEHRESDSCDDKHSSRSCSRSRSRSPSASPHAPAKKHDNVQGKHGDPSKSQRDLPPEIASENENVKPNQMAASKFLGSSQARRFGRSSARKNVSMESLECSGDEEEEIERLEAEKAELENQIEEEAQDNAKLLANLEKRKKSLHKRRNALEEEVAMLRDQLQKEKDLRAALEAGRNISRLPAASKIDEKTKADAKEVASAQKECNKLKHKTDELEEQISHEREQNAVLMQDRLAKMQETSTQKTKSSSKKEHGSSNASHHSEKSSKNEGQQNSHVEGGDHDDVKNEAPRSSSSKFGWFQNNAAPNPIPRATTSASKKQSKDDAANNSTFSKLTTRLNFLKERRNQIASELEHIDKGHSDKGNSSSIKNAKDVDPEGSSAPNQEDPAHQPSTHQPAAHPKDQGHRRSASMKPNSTPPKDLDSGRKSGTHSNQSLHRLKSDGDSIAKSVEKGSR